MAVRALIFDFDGLIVDTESASLTAWERVLAGYGLSMPGTLWRSVIGGRSSKATILAHMEQQIGPFDPGPVLRRWSETNLALVAAQPLRAGVADYLSAGVAAGLRLGIASSAGGEWVASQLRRVGVRDYFDVLSTCDRRPPKPAPDVYLAALETLGVAPGEAIAFEDSPTGVSAAKAAGLYCVAVPNLVTASLSFARADLVLPSMQAMPLHALLELNPA
ncbi:MAG TPA: HAD-IA family hydrolase [Candidatus Limnocylindrales bacterium]|nr:HAD-IA family hydrolase [Candidatus Limnocylindrales bacterium]